MLRNRAFIAGLRDQTEGGEHMKLSEATKRFDTQLGADGKSERTRQAYVRDLCRKALEKLSF
jgi:hypothetical protein